MTDLFFGQAEALATIMEKLCRGAETWSNDPSQVRYQFRVFDDAVTEIARLRDSLRGHQQSLLARQQELDAEVERVRHDGTVLNRLAALSAAVARVERSTAPDQLAGLSQAKETEVNKRISEEFSTLSAALASLTSLQTSQHEAVHAQLSTMANENARDRKERQVEAENKALKGEITVTQSKYKALKTAWDKQRTDLVDVTHQLEETKQDLDAERSKNQTTALGDHQDLLEAQRDSRKERQRAEELSGNLAEARLAHQEVEEKLSRTLAELTEAKEDLDRTARELDNVSGELQQERKRPRLEDGAREPGDSWTSVVKRLSRALVQLDPVPYHGAEDERPDGITQYEMLYFYLSGAFSKPSWAENIQDFFRQAPTNKWFCIEGTYQKGFRHEWSTPLPDHCHWHPLDYCCQIRKFEQEIYGSIQSRTINYSTNASQHIIAMSSSSWSECRKNSRVRRERMIRYAIQADYIKAEDEEEVIKTATNQVCEEIWTAYTSQGKPCNQVQAEHFHVRIDTIIWHRLFDNKPERPQQTVEKWLSQDAERFANDTSQPPFASEIRDFAEAKAAETRDAEVKSVEEARLACLGPDLLSQELLALEQASVQATSRMMESLQSLRQHHVAFRAQQAEPDNQHGQEVKGLTEGIFGQCVRELRAIMESRNMTWQPVLQVDASNLAHFSTVCASTADLNNEENPHAWLQRATHNTHASWEQLNQQFSQFRKQREGHN